MVNSMIEDKQYTMIWHADVIKISHISEGIVKSAITKLQERFEKITVKYGPVYDFIRIKIRFLEKGVLEVDMRSYLNKVVVDFGK